MKPIVLVDDQQTWRFVAGRAVPPGSGVVYPKTPDELLDIDETQVGVVILDRIMATKEWEHARSLFLDRLRLRNTAVQIVEWTADDHDMYPPVPEAVMKLTKKNGEELQGPILNWIRFGDARGPQVKA